MERLLYEFEGSSKTMLSMLNRALTKDEIQIASNCCFGHPQKC